MMIERLSRRHVVLLGIGHTNAHVLRMWKMHALPDTDLTCISDNTIATYSGMLPAVLAGQIPPERMEIDLVRLCGVSGARLLTNSVTGINHQKREINFVDRPPVPFDVLSIGIGSTASTEGVAIDSESFVMIKPMQSFLDRLGKAVKSVKQRSEEKELKIVVVGSGVAGVEIAFCIPAFIKSVSDRTPNVQLITRSRQILPSLEDKTRALVSQEFANRGVNVRCSSNVTHVDSTSVQLEDGSAIDADLVIWATNASRPSLLKELGLELDDRGFLATDNTLQSPTTKGIFAVGDTGTIVSENLAKAGVYAVRQGPVLWENIRRSLDGVALQKYEPQRSFMKLINLGDGRAVGQWKSFSYSGRAMMRLKERIDGRFMDKFQVTDEMLDSMGDDPMQCRGCGCKLGADVLDSALATQDGVVPDDAAEIGGEQGSDLLASTDFFSSPVEDAYLTGRIAALHSASDLIATGAMPTEALANVVLPEGSQRAQQRALHDFSTGAREEFEAMGASIVGGHTIIGPRMEVGFTVIGRRLSKSLLQKGSLKVGDHLYLTKGIGIGVLLAAAMRSLCPARDYTGLIDAMLQRQHVFAKIAVEHQITAATDITGFGLAGHLIEMLRGSGVSASVDLKAVPLLAGAAAMVAKGIESTLTPDNLVFEAAVDASHATRQSEAYRLLFDPQTCGGLLLGISDESHNAFVESVVSAGLPKPHAIGIAIESGEEHRIVLK